MTELKFRWSDNHTKAVEFTADRSSFLEAATDALLDMRVKTCKRSHRGEYRAEQQYCPSLELHLFDGRRFFRLGRVIDTAMGPRSAFVPEPFYVPYLTLWVTEPKKGDWPGAGHWPPPGLTPHDDVAYLRDHVEEIWERVQDTAKWGRALDSLVNRLVDPDTGLQE